MRTIEQLKREALQGLVHLDTALAVCAEPLPGLSAVEVAGSVNLLTAVREYRGIGKRAALVIALANMDDAARAAVEGQPVAEVA